MVLHCTIILTCRDGRASAVIEPDHGAIKEKLRHLGARYQLPRHCEVVTSTGVQGSTQTVVGEVSRQLLNELQSLTDEGYRDLARLLDIFVSSALQETLVLIAKVCRQYGIAVSDIPIFLDVVPSRVSTTLSSREYGLFVVPFSEMSPIRIWLHAQPPFVIMPGVPRGNPYYGASGINDKLLLLYREMIARL